MTEEQITAAVNVLIKARSYTGNDNSGKPKSDYLKKIILMSDEELSKECESKIWLSAYADNNPRSDYHWHCSSCYDECERRGKGNIYTRAHKKVSS